MSSSCMPRRQRQRSFWTSVVIGIKRAPHPPLRGTFSPLAGRRESLAALPPPLQHELLDVGDGAGGVEALGAGARAVHDGVAAVQLERILEVVQAGAGVLVAGVGDPAV